MFDRDEAGINGWREDIEEGRFYTTPQLSDRYIKAMLDQFV